MGRPAGWMKQLTGRDAMRSPGAHSHRREVERQFWDQVATGITSEKAAEAVGVSQAVGSRWFRHRGGMPLFMSKPVSDRYLSFTEREEIGIRSCQHGQCFEESSHQAAYPSVAIVDLGSWQGAFRAYSLRRRVRGGSVLCRPPSAAKTSRITSARRSGSGPYKEASCTIASS